MSTDAKHLYYIRIRTKNVLPLAEAESLLRNIILSIVIELPDKVTNVCVRACVCACCHLWMIKSVHSTRPGFGAYNDKPITISGFNSNSFPDKKEKNQ